MTSSLGLQILILVWLSWQEQHVVSQLARRLLRIALVEQHIAGQKNKWNGLVEKFSHLVVHRVTSLACGRAFIDVISDGGRYINF